MGTTAIQLASFGRQSTISNSVQTSATAGDHAEGVVVSALPFDAYPLCGFMFCRCGQPFHPFGWTEAARTYLSRCGCRLRPIGAAAVEERVKAAAELPPASSPVDEAEWVAIHQRFARVEVGGTIEDLRLVRRT